MSFNFDLEACQTYSNKRRFGLCDDPPPINNPAYLDETNGHKWIAEVENDDRYSVCFTAIDNCIEIKRSDNTFEKRCDGMLTYNSTIIFVELKERKGKGNAWVKDAEKQLRATILYFETTNQQDSFVNKKAWIVNSKRPNFEVSQVGRMERFREETGYVLRIDKRIIIE